ncbi:DUF6036 family nucleotidyltransferase [Sanguibacter sp. HDW7]|uniref:DUF6036 family nucleotidyltransferase n=1 Tax=Sanguibacter sp. HDW7 TaxID=2714931 RepID=UPI0014075366|nr:DUF6036 family nucleotidyltransferase [Sanguibacter sp. HDW7]QIK83385.1 hypothetical protein G7063_06920 [Sanguibacter sp. HDW7]
MRRSELEHILRAASGVARRPAFLVIGSQSVLGTWTESELPAEATMSAEVDLAPITEIDRAQLDAEVRSVLDGVYPTSLDAGVDPQSISDMLDLIGEFSDFHEAFDVYVQGVGADTAVLPRGWETRLVALSSAETGYAIGLCLDPLDACCAKLVAGRPHDYIFVAALLTHSLVDATALLDRSALLPPENPRSAMARSWAAAHST